MTTSHSAPLRRWRLFAALVVGLLCSHAAFAQEAPDTPPEAASVVDFSEADANASTAPSGQPVGDGFTEGAVVVTPGQMEEALGELVREYQRTGRAGVLRQSTVMVVPFGHSQPVLACAPLRASVVELQPGEVVLGVVAGDTERFAVEQTHTGPAGRTPLVVVKPLAYDVTTNLVVSTDRRVYHVTLDSAPRPSRARSRGGDGEVNPQPRYARHIRFYYPDDVAADAQPGVARLAPVPSPVGVLDADAPASLDDLHFDYQVTGDPELVEAVERVFDDGVHAYVKLSRRAVRGGEVPVLYAIGPGGDREVFNYAYRGGYYVTDRAVREAELVLGATVRTGFLGLGGRRQVERTARLLRVD
ncbi:TrbG/VirB9 family P-type conjugative transfer protein [Rubrivirga litoralis]|uniref:TrbG/VirB9 family P-type conjugative transfer protein n=1 Tax=Rubrivirga litoralis TaxID=3075598 RepID=A0ABU3BRR5_9BACT|nr:TrbG/VirB9 family P-type conjugative transfer protein [Rubrivirga sp. F394]MDT0631982.1 TrbG/VirB9 family P-type conjugative transfer protein [Rubrivirga sp. F394]